MGKLNRNAVRKFSVSDPDFEERNMMIFTGTPTECWAAIREANGLAGNLREKTVVRDGKLRRDVVRMYNRNDGSEPIDPDW